MERREYVRSEKNYAHNDGRDRELLHYLGILGRIIYDFVYIFPQWIALDVYIYIERVILVKRDTRNSTNVHIRLSGNNSTVKLLDEK